MEKTLAIVQALSDESRLRILLAIRGRELCVCKIVELLCLAPSTVSKHLEVLRHAGLVRGRKEGRWMHYRLSDGAVNGEAEPAISWICRRLIDDPRIAQDRIVIEKIILKDKRETLCRKGVQE